MKLLIAEDDPMFQKFLTDILAPDYELILVEDGNEAWDGLRGPHAPRLAILDWFMPGLTGPQICRRVRVCPPLWYAYLILLTSKNSEADIVSGLVSGADDYIMKPSLAAEVRARVSCGVRLLALRDRLEARSATDCQPFASEQGGRRPAIGGSSEDASSVFGAEQTEVVLQQMLSPDDCVCSFPPTESRLCRLATEARDRRHPR